MFSTYSIPTNHPLNHLPLRTQSLVCAFVRPRLPSNIRQHIARVYSNSTKLAEWLVQIICNDLATKFHSPVLCGTPALFAKVAPFVYREWTSNSNVEMCPTFVRGKQEYSNIVVSWLMVRFALPRIWDTVIHTIENENTMGYFGVIRHCQIIERKGDIVLQIQVEQ